MCTNAENFIKIMHGYAKVHIFWCNMPPLWSGKTHFGPLVWYSRV